MDASEFAVAEGADDVAFFGLGGEPFDDLVYFVKMSSGDMKIGADIFDQFIHIQPFFFGQQVFSGYGADDSSIALSQSLSQFFLKNIPASGIGSWFKGGPYPLTGIAFAQGCQSLDDSGGMVPKVVYDGDTGFCADHFHTAADAFKSVERGLDLFR